MHNIMDGLFSDVGRIDMYRSWVFPELYPGEPQARLENWHPEDLEAYCGGEYTPGWVDNVFMPNYVKEVV